MGGGILMICKFMSDSNTVDGQKLYRSIKPSHLATADGQKNCIGA